ncbi:hypothetical protein [Thermoanaerobacterium thermosaccharolyticum]|uniref:Uncharacterized protein n=1 Tax=Thermoanaerobacterium thermosaccharolyticum M0795 TaxID=698948 RepID=L0IKR7_THETR|nr:hypothetical protein [Thermoanaerobacterium thermosaccharolyticum]AGB19339.1 hypothetical protein Thethe_01710 [Thermoanaerobacterium thermosaccharolyticum M0795]
MIPTIFLNKEELINQELKNDLYYDRIKNIDLSDMTSMAWNRGTNEAKKYKNQDINVLLKEEGINFEINNVYYTPGYMIFSQITTNEKKITVYMRNIEKEFIPSIPEKYSFWKAKDRLINLFLCHEYYHYLEYYYIGLTSNIKNVNLKFGLINIKKQLNSLNEIAAHAFVKEFYNIW